MKHLWRLLRCWPFEIDCIFSLANDFSKIIVENDAISVVSYIKNKCRSSNVGSIVVKFLELLNSIGGSSYQFVHKLGNKFCHTIRLCLVE